MRVKVFNLFSLIAIVLCVSVVGCQKDYNPEVPEVPVVTDSTGTSINDSIYLDKVYYVDSIAGVRDTFAYDEYVYDANKRVIQLKLYEQEGSGVLELTHRNTYTYTGSDTLPLKRQLIYYPDDDTTITFFTYLPTGQNLTDSTIHYANPNVPGSTTYTTVNHFSYAPGKIFNVVTASIPSFPVTVVGRDTMTVDAAMNITSYKSYQESGGTSMLQYNGNFTYSTSRSPYSLLSNFRTLLLVPFGETFISDMQMYSNRLTSHEFYETLPSHDEDFTGAYRFGSNGLPSRIYEPYNPAFPDHYITDFKYRSL